MADEPQTSVADAKPAGGKLESSAVQAIIERHAEAFRQEIAGWRVNKKDKLSPPLSQDAQDIMMSAFYKLIEHFEKARTMPEAYVEYTDITRAIPALVLDGDLNACRDIRNYNGYKKEAVWHLMGDTIKAALNTAEEAGIIDNQRLKVHYKYFDRPYTQHNPLDLA